jgi:hypothetical protein
MFLLGRLEMKAIQDRSNPDAEYNSTIWRIVPGNRRADARRTEERRERPEGHRAKARRRRGRNAQGRSLPDRQVDLFGLRSAADELEGDDQAPAWLSSGFRQAADKLAEMADTLEGKSVRDIGRQTTQFARQNPTTFLAGSAAAGFALARFLRAGADYQGDGDANESEAAGTDSQGNASTARPATFEPAGGARRPTAPNVAGGTQ